MAQRRLRIWLFTARAERRQRAALYAVAAVEEADRRAAVRRVSEQAAMRLPEVRPAAPRLTPRQAERSRRAVR